MVPPSTHDLSFSFRNSLDLQVSELDSVQRTETASRSAASPQGSKRSLTDDQ